MVLLPPQKSTLKYNTCIHFEGICVSAWSIFEPPMKKPHLRALMAFFFLESLTGFFWGVGLTKVREGPAEWTETFNYETSYWKAALLPASSTDCHLLRVSLKGGCESVWVLLLSVFSGCVPVNKPGRYPGDSVRRLVTRGGRTFIVLEHCWSKLRELCFLWAVVCVPYWHLCRNWHLKY